MSQGSYSVIRSDTPPKEKTWLESWSSHLLYSDLDWLKLPEAATLRQVFKQSLANGGDVSFGKWRVSVNKGHYRLTCLGTGLYCQMNRNPKNLLEMLYSEDDAVEDMLQIMACGQTLLDLFDLIYHTAFPPAPKQKALTVEEHKLASLKRMCSCGGGENGVTHTKDCHWLPETIRLYQSLQSKQFQRIKIILNWFDNGEFSELYKQQELAAALEYYEKIQSHWSPSWGELDWAYHFGACRGAALAERQYREALYIKNSQPYLDKEFLRILDLGEVKQ